MYIQPLTLEACQNIDLLMNSQQQANLKGIVSVDFQVPYFLKILEVYWFLLQKIGQEERQEEWLSTLTFIVSLMHGNGRV